MKIVKDYSLIKDILEVKRKKKIAIWIETVIFWINLS